VRGRLFRVLVVAAAAALLHLPAHFAPWTPAPLRESLPEDGPVFVRNGTLAESGDEGVFAAARRAAADPAAAWSDAGDVVGSTRWRPVATTLHVAERAAPWAESDDGAVRGAAVVSLLLHVLVSLGAMRLAASLGGDSRASLLAGLLAAASPTALAAAAWPARQAAVLATALALGGTLIAQRGGALRLFAAGCVLALAGLAHEAAFGWVLAVPLLVRAASGGRARLADAWPAAIAPAVAFVVRHAVIAGFASAAVAGDAAAGGLRPPNLLDGLAGVLVAAASFVLPARSHFADGPFVFSFAGHATAIVVLAGGVAWLWRRASQPAAAAALAAVAALSPIVIALSQIPLVGGAAAAPYQDSYLYVALPAAAAAAGLAFAALAARRGPVRIAGVAAGAMLVGASVAATASRAPAFRTKSDLIALAKTETPRSPVVRAWDVFERVGSSPASSSGIAAVAPDVASLAADATGEHLERVRGDAVAAATLSSLFSAYASELRTSALPLTDPAYDAADAAGAAATKLRPGSARTWAVLAALRMRTGAMRGAVEAVSHAMELAPADAGVAALGAEIALAVGNARLAADTMERAVETLRADPKSPALTPELFMLYARALAADGTTRVADPSADKGLRYRYDLAADVLESVRDVASQRGPTSPAARLLYDVYVRYGDFLASADRPAMALLSYERASALTGNDPRQSAAVHAGWLRQRLAAEEAKAAKHYQEAATSKHDEIGTALLELYVAFCRQNKSADADDAFAKLEGLVHGVPPEMRLQRAVHRYAALEDAKDQAMAEAELRQVIREKPELHRAEYELARVLMWQGTLERLAEARELCEKAAREAVTEDWALDADTLAQVCADVIRTTPK
jgi:tetratricopeptide (TPR) repeat protein